MSTNEACHERAKAIKAYRRLHVLATITTNETWRQYFAHQRVKALRDALKADKIARTK